MNRVKSVFSAKELIRLLIVTVFFGALLAIVAAHYGLGVVFGAWITVGMIFSVNLSLSRKVL